MQSKCRTVFCITTILFVTVGLFACGGADVQKSPQRLVFKDDVLVVYDSRAFNDHPSLVQQVIFEQHDINYEFTAMVEIEKSGITIAGLSPMGQRQFVMTVDKNQFSFKAEPHFKLPFPPQYLLRDFMLVYATMDTLLAQHITAIEQQGGRHRDILMEGTPLIQIDYNSRYDSNIFSTGDIILTNHGAGYTLKLSTVQVDFPSEMIKTTDETSTESH